MNCDYFSSLPEDMWLTRPVGPWEEELLRWCDGRCTINLVGHIDTNEEEHDINIDWFRKSVYAMVYNEPHLRADLDLTPTTATWVPAKDFTQLFSFEVPYFSKTILSL